jgi:hypothetical protein
VEKFRKGMEKRNWLMGLRNSAFGWSVASKNLPHYPHLCPMKYHLLLFLLVATTTRATAQRRKQRLSGELQEISGLAQTPDGRLWAINDSGNAPTLYQLDPKSGKIIEKRPLPIPNVDWEELQTDGQGNLWIADFGNNANKRRRLTFYRYHLATGALDSLWYAYPDQKQFPPPTETERQFDCEAFLWVNDTLHVFTKSRFVGAHFTKHYTIPARPGPQVATLRDSLHLPKRAVTAAALSSDGRTMVLVAYFVKKRAIGVPYSRANAYFFTDFRNNDYFSGKMTKKRLPKTLVARQFESVAHNKGRHWFFANEGILWQRPRLWKLRGKY